ncbi:aminotransferase class I/II-fold pyridoxal phosphate-dependent enzyme [Acetobacter senegalensis]|uniref:aminotransferase class I/II-fold pyridoxal phosphate-dependent enzyme n=1 Tax=Acetobacter senegalensis TaxID=446692 RepID=UPI001EDA4016|nr:aminotransferase class I/II-fold pyridoxal phosphate-dependent enzyme [Acetobacter senegalensis]
MLPEPPPVRTSIACRPEIARLPPYNAGLGTEAVKSRYGVASVVKLGSNENPYGPPPSVGAALAGLMERVALYPEADLKLRHMLAAELDEPEGRIVLGNGSEQIIRMIPEAYVSPGDRVVTVVPSFGLHILDAEAMGGVVETVPVTEDCEFDLPAMIAAVSKPIRMLIFANPSNPVGCMMGETDLRALIEACPENCLIVVDEAYREYAEIDAGYPEARAILRAQNRPWIVLRTFSKAYGLAGLRIGYAVTSSEEIARTLGLVRDPFNTNIAAQLAAIGALQGLEHVRDTVAQTACEREVMRERLEGFGLHVAPSLGNFLFFRTAIPSGELAERLLCHGVIVKPWKEAGYTDWTRVSIGLPAENARFLAVLSNVLESAATRETLEA